MGLILQEVDEAVELVSSSYLPRPHSQLFLLLGGVVSLWNPCSGDGGREREVAKCQSKREGDRKEGREEIGFPGPKVSRKKRLLQLPTPEYW